MQKICVFCGSSPGLLPDYLTAARELGAALVRHDLGLVYGGAHVGLMGEIANSVMQHGGEVIGVMPQSLIDREIAHRGLSELHVVQSMHERKAKMAELADGFIALPGGFGTLEELFEIVTWGQLGLHRKPFGLLNVNQFFDQLIGFLDFAVGQQFIRPQHREMILVDAEADRLLARFAAYEPPSVTKWIDRAES
ncbi:MAG: TIGR00730 family Rossman fold protein [Chloroflexi bacterium]|nr:TIGR00730 family Rossman fold protein [Chloroflexota bacterium]